MSKIAMLSLLFTLMSPGAFGYNHEAKQCSDKCTCTQECKENCQKGKGQDCKCEELRLQGVQSLPTIEYV